MHRMIAAMNQYRISSILDILWPSRGFWWPTDLDDSDVQPGLLDKPKAAPLTVLEVQAAADVVQRLSELYDYDDIEHVGWSADELRDAAEQMAQ
jgi:hypothetical protein